MAALGRAGRTRPCEVRGHQDSPSASALSDCRCLHLDTGAPCCQHGSSQETPGLRKGSEGLGEDKLMLKSHSNSSKQAVAGMTLLQGAPCRDPSRLLASAGPVPAPAALGASLGPPQQGQAAGAWRWKGPGLPGHQAAPRGGRLCRGLRAVPLSAETAPPQAESRPK